MSTLKVNDIQEATSGGSKVFMNRMFCVLNGKNTITIRNDGNVSSVTDNGVGDYTSTLGNALSTSQHSLATGLTEYAPSDPGGNDVHLRSNSGTFGSDPVLNTGTIRVEVGRGGSANDDYAYVSWAAMV